MHPMLPTIILATTLSPEGATRPDVEKAYWDCEYAALRGEVDLDAGAACHDVYELMKQYKFDGNFNRFLVWWQRNKDAEMALRARSKQPRRDQ